MANKKSKNNTTPRQSWTFDEYTNSEIRRAAETGIYDIRGGGSKRKLPHFDDLLFLGASMSRYPLEGYREKCLTNVTLGTRFAKKPLKLDIPITIAGMSFGALSGPAKEASFAGPDKAPKLIPAIVMGISSLRGFFANLVPRVTLVKHFSLYPSRGYRDIEAPKKSKSSKCGSFLLDPPPLISYIPVSAALLISEFVYSSNVHDCLGVVLFFDFLFAILIFRYVIYVKII